MSMFDLTLSQCMHNVLLFTKPRDFRRFQSHMASFAPWQLVVYSASVLDVTMVGCFLELQDIRPELRLNGYPEIEQRELTHAPQSESTHPMRLIFGPPRMRVLFLVAYRYCMVCRAAVQ